FRLSNLDEVENCYNLALKFAPNNVDIQLDVNHNLNLVQAYKNNLTNLVSSSLANLAIARKKLSATDLEIASYYDGVAFAMNNTQQFDSAAYYANQGLNILRSGNYLTSKNSEAAY